MSKGYQRGYPQIVWKNMTGPASVSVVAMPHKKTPCLTVNLTLGRAFFVSVISSVDATAFSDKIEVHSSG